MDSPKVFVSYSYDSPDHKSWVGNFASKIREYGIDVTYDRWEILAGDDLPAFMERQLLSADFVIVVCTKTYCEKANAGVGGVGYEKMILTADLMSKIETRKIIPVMRNNPEFIAPTFIRTKLWIDFSDGCEQRHSLRMLLDSLGVSPSKKPPLGSKTYVDLESPHAEFDTLKKDLYEIKFVESHDQEIRLTAENNYPWFDTSYSDVSNAVGELRYVGVGNGRYEEKHPVLSKDGELLGYLVNAFERIGYTFNSVYVNRAGCFFLTHVPFNVVLGGGPKASFLSIVECNKRFFWSKLLKFELVKSFRLPEHWVGVGILAFKLLCDDRFLLFLTQYGYCLIDTINKELLIKVEFREKGYCISDYALSPRVNLLVLLFSVPCGKDRLDGDQLYQNLVQIYDVEAGAMVGEQFINRAKFEKWRVGFSDDGRTVEVMSRNIKKSYKLEVREFTEKP